MVCRVKTPKKVLVFSNSKELLDRMDEFPPPYWIAKCEGDDEETAEMRSLLLDMADGIAFYTDGSFSPYELYEIYENMRKGEP